MEPIASLSKRPKFPEPAADGNKFEELPEAIVHRIFSFLEIVDLMTARAVSKHWRYLWTSMPHLDFNYAAASTYPFYDFDKYDHFINWVLMTRDECVSVQSCRLQCSKDYESVNKWLDALAKNHVRKLYLNLSSENENPFVLPCCLLASVSLEVLKIELEYCVLEIPSCEGFRRLKSLKLASIVLVDQNSFQNFISSCPLLEKLTLEECQFYGFKDLDISSRNLRKLVVMTDTYNQSDTLSHLKITCPNLVRFALHGSLKSFSWGKNPCFLQTTILSLSLHDGGQALNDKFINFVLEILRRVRRVEILKLGMFVLKCISPAVAKAGCVPTIFYNLKVLRLSGGVETCTQSIIHVLKGAPNLQHLSVFISHKVKFERDYKCKMLDENIECLKCHLKLVKLINLDSCDGELELIRFVLKNAYVVDKMIIVWGHWLDGENQREGAQKVLKFPRSSSHVNVTFIEQKRLGEYQSR